MLLEPFIFRLDYRVQMVSCLLADFHEQIKPVKMRVNGCQRGVDEVGFYTDAQFLLHSRLCKD